VANATKAMKARHKLTGIVAPAELHEALYTALVNVDLVGAAHVHDLERDQVPVFSPEAVKGLEFDGVIVVNPHEILSAGGDPQNAVGHTPRGARLLYVAMTRAVQEVHFVTDSAAPPVVAP
jgi:superfamily I DNA/RNA helicase